MSIVAEVTILKDITNNVKSVIDAQVSTVDGDGKIIIDPKRPSRNADKEPFLRTTAARRAVYYPHIVLSAMVGTAPTLSLLGDAFRYSILTTIKIVADNVKDLDALSGQLQKVMRTSRIVFNSYNMKRPKDHFISGTDVTPRGVEANIKERTLVYRFIFYAQ